MLKILLNFFVFLLFLASQTAWAQAKWQPVATISMGSQWARGGESQRLYLQSDIENAYIAHRETDRLMGLELFWGMQRELTPSLVTQLGIVFAKSADAHMQGDIWVDADPEFDNYDYRYQVSHQHIGVKGLLLMPVQYGLLPFISASIGVGSNQASNFISTPKIEEEVALPAFGDHIKTSFTYTLSIGLRKILTQHWQVGASYEFADWGKSQLNPAPGQTTHSGLKLDHLYTQGVYIDVSYVFDATT